MRRRYAVALAVWLASTGLGGSAQAERNAIQASDLLLVRARLRACPDRLRLLEVIRVEAESVALLDLGSFAAIGRTPDAVLREVRARYRTRVPGSELPPIDLEVLPHAAVSFEVEFLETSLADLDCKGFRRREPPRPDRTPNPLFERIAAR